MASNTGTSGGATAALAAMGPPYPPQTQGLGSPPTPIPDVPVAAVFLALYLVTGPPHLALFVRNKKAGHKFPFSMAMFAFCFIRLVTNALRIGLSYHSHNVRLAIAAQVFVSAGVVILYVINIFFAQRLMRARHPKIGWNKIFSIFVPVVFTALVPLSIIMIIVVIIQSFYTLNGNTRRIDRDVQWYGFSYFAFVAFLPVLLVAIMMAVPRRTVLDKFGSGHFRTKIWILLIASTILTLGAAFRCGTGFLDPTPLGAPTRWYYSKASFYCFDFLTEYIVVLGYLVLRVDQRFYIPDGTKAPGSYRGAEILNQLTEEEIRDYNLSRDGHTLTLADGRQFTVPDASTLAKTEQSS